MGEKNEMCSNVMKKQEEGQRLYVRNIVTNVFQCDDFIVNVLNTRN